MKHAPIVKKKIDVCSYLVVHGSYLINFIKTGQEKQVQSVVDDILFLDSVVEEVNKSRTGVVIHLGKNTEHLTVEECIQNFIINVKEVLQKTFAQKVRLILETSTKTKNGNDVFWDIRVFGQLVSKMREEIGEDLYRERIGFCVDTAHVFASGYDIRTKEGVREFLSLWDREIGVERISLLHLNDSKVGVGCCRDLHEQIGKGCLYAEEKEGLRYLLEWCRGAFIPVILETGGNLVEELELLLR
jgi:deoxyribonuclease-4